MKNIFFFLFMGTIILSGCSGPSKKTESATQLEIKNQWYYINGDKFFIKGIGYEIGARPGQDPYKDTIADLARMKHDLQVIKKAGFNTIRTWSQLSEEQLKVVHDSGLKIIFGIWIDPHGDFGDEAFLNDAIELTNRVVSYTQKYDCIISYLILNEPLTDHVHNAGAEELSHLLTTLKAILNENHPGIPVSFSGSAPNADFIDMTKMDFIAYNNYDYGSYQNGTMGYGGFLKWCYELNKNKSPLVVTEFGYSVSGNGPGNYGYGGNTLEQQRQGLLRNYREILDAGATGACPFYYADGWWKGNEPDIHNDAPEEWFGFFGYSHLEDTIGAPRPVWYALNTYMKALVLSPKNQAIYGDEIPLEFFLDKDIKHIIVKLKDSVLYAQKISREGYLADAIKYIPKGMEDAELTFDFFDGAGNIIKSEVITALLSVEPITLPKLEIDLNGLNDLTNQSEITMNISLRDLGDFTLASDIHYNFNFHIGWETGPEGNLPLHVYNKSKEMDLEKTVPIPSNSWVVVPSAGVTVKYGKYLLHLHDEDMIFRGSWADALKVVRE